MARNGNFTEQTEATAGQGDENEEMIDIRDLARLQGYWLLYKDEVEKQKELPEHRPRVDIERVVNYIVDKAIDVIEKHHADTVSVISEKQAEIVEQAEERIEPLCYALLYAYGHLPTENPDLSREQIRERMAEANDLASAGEHWLDVLVAVGTIEQGKARELTAGRSYMDTALFLVNVSEIIEASWHLLGPLQQEQDDPKLTLTAEKVAHMNEVGTWLAKALSGKDAEKPESEIDWTRQVIGLYHLLEQDYHVLRTSTVYALRLARKDVEAEVLTSIRAMSQTRRATRRPDDGEKNPPDSTSSTTVLPAPPEPASPAAPSGSGDEDKE